MYFTVNEAADYLRVTTRSIYRYIESGQLKAKKTLSGSWRISKAALDEFLGVI